MRSSYLDGQNFLFPIENRETEISVKKGSVSPSIKRTHPVNTSTLIFGWKWKLSRRTFIDNVSTLTKQHWNNIDRVTLIPCWWPSVVLTLILGWKGKSSQLMFIDVEKTALEQICQYLLYWGSLESGSIIKQN